MRGVPPNGERKKVVKDLAAFAWHRGKSKAVRLTRALSIPDAFAGVAERGRPQMFDVGPQVKVSSLKPFQVGIVRAVQARLAGTGRVMASSYTGTGKTRMGLEFVISRLLESESGGLIVWVAQKRELLDQAADAMEELWPWKAADCGESLRVFRFMAGARFETADIATNVGILFATSQQLIARIKDGDPFLSEALRRSLALVIDEAHFAHADGHRAIIEAYQGARAGQDTRVLGLTATPGRSNLTSSTESRELAELFGSTLVVPTVDGQPLALSWFQDSRILAQLRHRQVAVPSQVAQTTAKRQLASRDEDGDHDFTAEVLEIIGEDSQRNAAILQEVIILCEAGRSALVFCCNISQAEFLFQALLLSNVGAGLIHHKIDPRDRRGTIVRFRRGELQVLLNVEVLTTGFDAPKVDTIVMCRPTLSRILYEQMVGRGLRGPDMGGTEWCEIIDLTDNFNTFHEPLAYEAFWADWDPTAVPETKDQPGLWEVVKAEPESAS